MTPTPTNKLRFVERKDFTDDPANPVVRRILQQWWETASGGTLNLGWGGEIPIGEVTGEWRDVPVEMEGTK